MFSVLGTIKPMLAQVRISTTKNRNSLTSDSSGDSGSPLLWVDDLARWSVAGIVSFGPSVCGQDVPGAYTKVESYLDWIENMIT